MTNDTMTDRVRKLFAKAESTSSTHEAEALLAKAYALLAKHGIDEAIARAGAGTDSSEIGTWEFTATGPYKYDQIVLVGQVADALHCMAVRMGDRNRVRVFGARRHLDRVEMLAGMLVAYMLTTAGKATNPHPWAESTVTYRKSVMLGFAVEVARRLKEAERTAAAESSDEAGAGIVLASDARRAERAMREALGPVQNGSAARRSQHGVEAGRAAAASVDLGGGSRLSGRAAIAG